MMVSPKWKQVLYRSLAVSISIVVALLLCEILVRIVAPQNLSGGWFERSPRGYDINRANWTVRHQFGDRIVYYHLNEFHLRGASPGLRTNCVLCLGDSFTFGWLLEEKDTFVDRLDLFAARDFPGRDLHFVNGGVAGSGTADQLGFVEDFAPQIRPSAIIIFLNNDDAARSVRGGLFRLDPVDSSSVVTLHPRPPGLREALRATSLYQWSLEHIELAQLARKAFQLHSRPGQRQQAGAAIRAAEKDAGIQLEKALFLRLRDWCRAHHCRLFVVTTGFNDFSDFPLGRDGDENKGFLEEAPQFFQNNGIAFHDLGPELFAASHGDYHRIVIAQDNHPDGYGAGLIADFTWSWLKPRL